MLKQKHFVILSIFFLSSFTTLSQGFKGYYRFPDISNGTIVFTAEGDLWKVSENGGIASRLTSHPGEEVHPKISKDGKTIAFTASYEGPNEIYTIPFEGGIPERWTFEREWDVATDWTRNGELIYSTTHYSTLPDYQLIKINPATKNQTQIPLYQASEGTFNDDGTTVFFVRPADHRNVTKRYKGGTARKIWKYTDGAEEAVRLSDDFEGESHHPMWWNGRVYFLTDRDGTMNIWSMDEEGKDLKQHTSHVDFDARYASQNEGKIVYQRGADIWLYDINSNSDTQVSITLASDFDQVREKWVDDPAEYITSMNIHPNGEQIVLTARGRVFVIPTKRGRLVQLSRKEGVRYRDATFSSDGKNIHVLSDETGEFEFFSIPASGIGNHKQLTDNGEILRYEGISSPDGKWIAYDDLNSDMWILNIASGKQTRISTNDEGIGAFSWSPDSKWVAFSQWSANQLQQIMVHGIESGETFPVTTDRANSQIPQWSPDGKWLYFLSDRNFQSLVGSPWGSRQPEPYFDKKWKLYHISLRSNLRSPFQPDDELYTNPEDGEKDKNEGTVVVNIDKTGILERIMEVPVEPGNYSGLAVSEKAVYFSERGTGLGSKNHLMVLKIGNDDPQKETMVEDIRSFELSADVKKLLIRKGDNFYVVDAGTSKISSINDHKIDLSGWKFKLNPREDWRQLYTDAWRMERDYFYDPGMHGVDWDKMHEKYLPLVDRVTTRQELSDLIGRFVGELSALHTSVRGGDTREGNEDIDVGSLGALFSRTDKGYKIERIYRVDPDYPHERGPLDHPGLGLNEGDIITHVDGDNVLETNHINSLLRNKADKQVRLTASTSSGTKDFIVVPTDDEYSVRYRDWEYSRRMKVEADGQSKLGYVHLRAMGSRDISQWYREFYPVFNRQGLIIDVRGNRGGNIESFILEKLMRTAWFYWKTRTGTPYPNMQFAPTGHMVVLMDARTASDGEAFAEGFKRLGLGKLIGVRTWGGEIWLSSVNRLSDGGLARAPMMGVYGLESEWLIEGIGVIPDIEVDNLPHATFNGEDAQLDAAIKHLKNLIAEDPRLIPEVPAYPDKSFGGNGKKD